MTTTDDPRFTGGGKLPRATAVSVLYRRETRELIFQVLLVAALVMLFWSIISNTATNLKARNIASGFGFMNSVAGFDIAQTMIEYTARSTYLSAFYVGLINTLIVAVIGIFLATVLGFIVGIARLSSNWLIARLAGGYVEVVRNCPLLLQMFLWYFAVLKTLPEPLMRVDGKVISTSKEMLFGTVLLNTRGLYMPKPEWLPGAGLIFYALLAAIMSSIALSIWSRRRQLLTGQRFPVGLTSLGLLIALPLVAYFVAGRPVQFEYPTLGRFNLSGGLVVQPEFFAVVLGLVFYTAAYIAEVVRAGINGVSKGQKEAAAAIGLTKGQTMRLVTIPQAMRIIIPPLTSQYLNLTKNSSLAGAIGYPDLVQVLGTINNQTGQAVETTLTLMAVYLTTSLLTSAFMNWFNSRMALVER